LGFTTTSRFPRTNCVGKALWLRLSIRPTVPNTDVWPFQQIFPQSKTCNQLAAPVRQASKPEPCRELAAVRFNCAFGDQTRRVTLRLAHLAKSAICRGAALRQKLPLAGSKSNFCFTPESRLNSEIAACPKSARLGSKGLADAWSALRQIANMLRRWGLVSRSAPTGPGPVFGRGRRTFGAYYAFVIAFERARRSRVMVEIRSPSKEPRHEKARRRYGLCGVFFCRPFGRCL
jgi:hypothetical protein